MDGANFLRIVIESLRFEIFEKMNGPETGVQDEVLPARKFGDCLKGFLQGSGWFEKSQIESLSAGFLSFHALTIGRIRRRFLDLGQSERKSFRFSPNLQCPYPRTLRRETNPGASW